MQCNRDGICRTCLCLDSRFAWSNQFEQRAQPPFLPLCLSTHSDWNWFAFLENLVVFRGRTGKTYKRPKTKTQQKNADKNDTHILNDAMSIDDMRPEYYYNIIWKWDDWKRSRFQYEIRRLEKLHVRKMLCVSEIIFVAVSDIVQKNAFVLW